VSKLADFKDGVFIGEVFESTFIQIGELQRDFTVVNNEFILFKETTKADIQSIMKVYSDAEKNKTVIYDALKNIRYNATVLQLKTHSNCNPTLCTIR
jgi:sorbitol-specific phosphotransferase system component IIA